MLPHKSMPSTTASVKRGNAVSNKVELDFQSTNSIRQRFIAFDVETTGFQPTSDRIAEIGAVLFLDGKPEKTFSSLVNPGIHMPASASRVNHITDDMLANAPTEREVYPKLIDFLGDALQGKTIMCAHNANFDFSFLCATLSRLGYDASIKYMDTLGIARKYLHGLENHKQGTIEAHYGLVNAASHRAASDAENCGHILCRLLDEAEEDLISEQRRHEESKPTQQEMMVCAYVQQLIGAKGGDTELLRYRKNSTGHVDMCCLYPFLRMKFSQKGRYILIKKDYVLPESILTTACSQSEGGHEFVRAFFSSPFELATLTDYIFDAYSAKRSSMETYSTRNSYTRRETEEAMRAMHALTDEEAAALVEAARGCEYVPVSTSISSEPHITRADVVITPPPAPAPKGISITVTAPAAVPKEERMDAPVPAPAMEPAACPAPAVRTRKKILRYEGRLAGTVYNGRQKIIARLIKKEEEGEVIEFSLEESTYKGKPSIKVMAEVWCDDASPKHIGFIAAKDVDKVLPLIDTADVDVIFDGGPDAGYDYEEDHDYYYGGTIYLYTEA